MIKNIWSENSKKKTKQKLKAKKIDAFQLKALLKPVLNDFDHSSQKDQSKKRKTK